MGLDIELEPPGPGQGFQSEVAKRASWRVALSLPRVWVPVLGVGFEKFKEFTPHPRIEDHSLSGPFEPCSPRTGNRS